MSDNKNENKKEKENIIQPLSEQVIKKIEQEKIFPKPKWSFFLKNYFVWSLGALSVLFGAISFSLIIYLFKDGSELSHNNFGATFWEVFLGIVPVFWLIFLGLFTFIAFLNIKNAKRAYKYSPALIFVSSIIVSIALGATLYMFGASQKFDNLLGRNAHPFLYKNFMNPQIDFWSEAEKGRLAGIISEVNSDKSFFIVDIDSNRWLVYYTNLSSGRGMELRSGILVKCFGKKISDTQFEATEIMPMVPGKEFFNSPRFNRNFEGLNSPKMDFQPLMAPKF